MNSHTTLWLVLGAVGGATSFGIAWAMKPFTTRVFGVTLIIAAAAYAGFAWNAGAGSAWMAIEIAGIIAFGSFAAAGTRRSPWWLVVGWALHPLWDVPLHYFGPGHELAPASYAIACLSWDWVTALAIAIFIPRSIVRVAA